ncbi:cyclin Cig1 [Schizosaccharomyces cryophilus OY26]|uniref:Cyclin Cig1 n=1 Tax=Schizosaccharomyces cryophilus (strain OY26 / ATCC MYA-4695 / CBS 11777 / NBRC 106824 / NRRL Y48691) TaxID=653667 RepID=S9X0U6_SCHCR|nr:cyclin Cig1 [Schizosaccharomyces cryophilus OY26]EPY50607.1 cyclin Cig1 [Schizosaccharomyces cryophilus OY26]
MEASSRLDAHELATDENQTESFALNGKGRNVYRSPLRAPLKSLENVSHGPLHSTYIDTGRFITSPTSSETEKYVLPDEKELDSVLLNSVPEGSFSDQKNSSLDISEESFDLNTSKVTEPSHVAIPFFTEEDFRLLSHASKFVKAHPSKEDDDQDPSMVSDYETDIFQYMHELEMNLAPSPSYMSIQQEIDWPTRHLLIDWIIQVHHYFRLLPETLYLTVNLVDRFLSIKLVSFQKIQLVGLSALLIAFKYEEIHPPTIYDLGKIVEGVYELEEIIRAERYMLMLLKFELSWPGPMSFLRRISRADSYQYDIRSLSKYLMELTLMDEMFVGGYPSVIAAASYYLSMQMLGYTTWTLHHIYYSGLTARQLEPCALGIMECILDAPNHHRSIFQKYSESRMKRISVFAYKWVSSIL